MERMTVKEAAKFLGISEFKLYDMVRLKQIPHFRIGAKIIFRTETLNNWIEEQEQNYQKIE